MEDYCLAEDVFVGLDPGATGALALITGDNYVVVDLPVMVVSRGSGTKTEFNYPAIVKLFQKITEGSTGKKYVGLEKCQVMPKANHYVAFRLGAAYNMWPLFFCQLGYSVEEFPPAVWKKNMGLSGKDKEASRHKALQLFPSADILRKKDHNRAEALLLAEHLRRKRNG